MKSSQIILIVIGFILVALMATNPSIDEHKDAIKKELFSAIESDNNSNRNNAQILGEKIGESIGKAIIDRAVNRQNFLLFSFGTFENIASGIEDKVTLGIFGQIFLLKKYDKESKRFYKETNKEVKADTPTDIVVTADTPTAAVDNSFKKNESKSDNKFSVLGNPIKIGNLEVAQNDFPNTMSWKDAKKACSDLGEGWRLPTIDELKILYENPSLISNFLNGKHWSSTFYNADNDPPKDDEVFTKDYKAVYGSSVNAWCLFRAVRSF